METCSQNYLELLPLELRQQILASVPDVGTLRTAVLSCPALYYAFHESPISTITSVLSSEIGPAVLPEAAMVLEASSIGDCILSDPHMADTILQNWLQREKVRWKWTLADALAISNLHFYVHSFAMKFASTALPKIPSCYGQQSEYSQQELERIKRALYRFEIYCNLFPLKLFEKVDNLPVSKFDEIERLTEGFFSKFAPWENEQLSCIHDFLAREVIPAFNDVAFHDILYGEIPLYCVDKLDDPQIQIILSYGLRKLYDIATSSTYEARYKSLEDKISDSVVKFLYVSLTYQPRQANDTARLEEYTKEQECTLVSQPFFDDPNIGPEKAWRLAYAQVQENSEGYVNMEYQWAIREWGYVFWSLERLIASGVLQNGWEAPDFSFYTAPCPTYDEQQRSWRARALLYFSRKRGYWDDKDQSN